MIFIQQNRTTARFLFRRLRCYSGGSTKPALLLVRFGDSEQPGTLSEGRQYGLAELQNELAKILAWTEEVPCWLWVAQNGSHPLIPKAINFIHRLDCSTSVYTDGTDIDLDVAYSWIDAGLQTVCVGIGGVSHELHSSAVHSDVEDATNAVRHFLTAKSDRNASLKVEICIPWTEKTPSEIDAILSWANEAGVERIQIVEPFTAAPLGSLKTLDGYQVYRHPTIPSKSILGRLKRGFPHNKILRLFLEETSFVLRADQQRVELSIDRRISFGSKAQGNPKG